MATFYVSTAGSNTAPYDTWAKAANLFSTANSAASTGDTIILDYGDHVISGYTSFKSVYIKNRDLDNDYTKSTFIYDTGNVLSRIVVASNSPTFTGITISGFAGDFPAVNIPSNTSGVTKTITLNYCKFIDNGAGNLYGGGAIGAVVASANTIDVYLTGCVFTNCQAPAKGGAVYVRDKVNLYINNCDFNSCYTKSGGTTDDGGGLCASSLTGVTSVSISNSSFTECKSSRNGGGCLIDSVASVSITDTTFTDCEANYEDISDGGAGAGVCIIKNSTSGTNTTANISGCTFLRCYTHRTLLTVTGDGAGVQLYGGNPTNKIIATVSDCTFAACYADQGAGFYASRYCEAVVTNCYFADNYVYRNGGATFRGGGPSDCEGNQTVYKYCMFMRNKAGYNYDGTIGAFSGPEGGAVGIRIYPRADFINCTFDGNYVASGGTGDAIKNGVIQGTPDPMSTALMRSSLQNTVVFCATGNDVPIRSEDNGWTEITTSAYQNTVVLGTGITPTGTVTLASSPYKNTNGELLDASTCRNTGTNVGLTSDYLGRRVPIGPAPDIGAYESAAFDQVQTPSAASIPYANLITIYNKTFSQAELENTTT